MSGFYCILTTVGAEKLALAAAAGVDMAISYMAVGDGGGSLPAPDPNQESLLGEQYRAELNSLRIFDNAESVISAEMIIPPEFGGFWIREVGLYSDDGALVAVGNLPPTYKPRLIEGSGRTTTVRTVLAVSSTGNVRLLIDPTVVVATISYVDERFREAKNRADDAYQLAAGKTTFDYIYPPGISVFFATNLNPNQHWKGTKWYYTGENKTVRIAKADGSDVLTSGGADSVTLTAEHLPKHKHNVRGNTDEFDHGKKGSSEFDYGKKTTTENGKHRHQGGMDGPGEAWMDDYIVGSDNDSHRRLTWTSENGEHAHEVDIGQHAHEVDIGKHSHGVNIDTSEVGEGKVFSVVESHIKLMCWYRAA
ncbi:MAG: phage tail protein [Serratia liquefaciens]|nr:phage tail protein [Serratia liquefaciens]